ncbi:MAG TPA: YjfB family protein [Oxalicibacterium sp.]|nr:YjfB family protein [Oxalicibacterium sp.]
MDTTSSVASLSAAEVQDRQNQAAGIATLRKTLQMQGKQAASLIDSISQAPSVPNLPEYLGKNIDTTA